MEISVAFFLALIAALALTPIVWLHYFALLAVPIAIYRPRFASVWVLFWLFWVTPHQGGGDLWRIALVYGVVIAMFAVSVHHDALQPDAGCPMSISAVSAATPRLARLSVPIALGLTVVVAAALHVVLGMQIDSPWIVPDEIRYAELAKSLGDGNLPAIRDQVTFEFGLGYPLLLAPDAGPLFDDVAARVRRRRRSLNAVRDGASPRYPRTSLRGASSSKHSALIAAALSVAIPLGSFRGHVDDGGRALSGFRPSPSWAIAVALERPTHGRRNSQTLGAIALASTIKVLAVTLLLGFIAAIPALSLAGHAGPKPMG